MASRLAAFYFAFFAYAGAHVAYFPLYLADRGLSPAHIAWVLALGPLTRIFAPAAWGWVADRTGAHRAVVAFSCAVTAGAYAVLPYTSHIAWVIGLMSVLSAGALPIVEAITLGSLAGQSGRYGPIRLWGSVGFIAVVLAGGAWLDFQPVSTLPAALVAFMLAALVVALALPSTKAHAAAPAIAFRVGPEARALFAAGICNAIAHGALYAFLSLHLEALGYSATTIGMLWTLGVLAEIVVFFYLPQIFRRFALSTILVASLLAGALRFAAIGWGAGHLWIVLLAQLLHAATFGSFHAASVAAVHRLFPEHAQARGQALFSGFVYGAGAAAGLVISGWAWQLGGAPLAFSLAALGALAGAIFAGQLKGAGL
ncbi:MAG TPA: MFS transporter [Burkholderiales bacterium]|nr:MFS transporter [Burkholderiales bacterium]